MFMVLPVRRSASSISEVTVGMSVCSRLTSSPWASLICRTMGSAEGVSPLPGVLLPPLEEAPPSGLLEAAPPWLTMTVTMLRESPLDTTMEVDPTPTAVTVPPPLTVATLVSLERKVRACGALEGETLPVIRAVSPGLRTR